MNDDIPAFLKHMISKMTGIPEDQIVFEGEEATPQQRPLIPYDSVMGSAYQGMYVSERAMRQ